MTNIPDISQIGVLIGDPARASMLAALIDGRALTATELAEIGGVTAQTASSHLQKLQAGGLIRPQKQGRHKYFSLADSKVAGMLESLMQFASDRGHLRHRPGPRDEALRKARVCYDHLAGNLGVLMYDGLVARRYLAKDRDEPVLTDSGRDFLARNCMDLDRLKPTRRPLCLCCLDWSERRDHLAGALGAALYDHVLDRGWASRDQASRAVNFNPEGEAEFRAVFAAEL